MTTSRKAIGICIAAIVMICALVTSVSASNTVEKTPLKSLTDGLLSPGVVYSESINTSYILPAPGVVHEFSVPCYSTVTIWAADCCREGDRYEVLVDGRLIGTTPDLGHCSDGSGILSNGTFNVELRPGEHTLQFRNTGEPCFNLSNPPNYADAGGSWLPSGFFFSYNYECHEVPTLTPIGLIALVGLLSALAAVTITKRKRR